MLPSITTLAFTCFAPQVPPSEPRVRAAEPLASDTNQDRSVELMRRSKAERGPARERPFRIQKELEQPNLPLWAREYAISRGGLFFDVSPNAGMVACKSSDVVGTDRWNHGAVVAMHERSFDVESSFRTKRSPSTTRGGVYRALPTRFTSFAGAGSTSSRRNVESYPPATSSTGTPPAMRISSSCRSSRTDRMDGTPRLGRPRTTCRRRSRSSSGSTS